jgi:NAD(P)-dependent dehydrogenase (short-subunit alcohol dehydrogenase family)
LSDIIKVIELNLDQCILRIQGILPVMRNQQRGTIINAALNFRTATPSRLGSFYSVSKAGLIAPSPSKKLLSAEASNGIRVVSFCPFGSVNTRGYRHRSSDLLKSVAMLTLEIMLSQFSCTLF